MKATIEIPDDLYRQVKAKNALEGRAVREVTEELFRGYVEQEFTQATRKLGEVPQEFGGAPQEIEFLRDVSEFLRGFTEFRHRLQPSLPPVTAAPSGRDQRA